MNRARVRGVAEIRALAIERVGSAWSSSETLIFHVRGVAGAPPPPDREDLVFRQATWGDADSYARAIGTDSATTFRNRLGTEVRCFLVTSDDEIVHASWVTTSGAWTREIGAFVTPPAGDAYLYESFTRADQRGRGIYPFALESIVHTLGGEGIVELWIGAEASNHSSIRALRKAGFAEGFRLPYRRRMGRLIRGRATGPRAAAAADLITGGGGARRARGNRALGDRPNVQTKQ